MKIKNYVAGEWRETETTPRHSPTDNSILWEAPSGDAAVLADAVDAATAAYPAWRATSMLARGGMLATIADHLSARAEQVAIDLTREEGKILTDAHGEVARAIGILRYFATLGMHQLGEVYPSADPATSIWTTREPRGCVGLITPWNFPIAIPTWKLAPALLSGNTAVLKPAEWTPRTAAHLAECAHEAGLPAGVINVVFGTGDTVGQALVEHPDTAAISFTGSTSTGKKISEAVAHRTIPTQLEMGGKNAVIVLEDASPQAAADIIARGGWGQTGQTCTATSRVICVGKAYDQVLTALQDQAKSWKTGDPQAAGTTVGPVVHQDQLARDVAAIDSATTDGATLSFGGESDGLHLSPALLETAPGPGIWRDEIFGPIIAAVPADDLNEAIDLANDSDYGLVSGIITNDFAAITTFTRQSQTGLVKVNLPTAGLELHVPFGGTKGSSNGAPSEQGQRAVDFYTTTKIVYQTPLRSAPTRGA